ncbi:MAG: SusE domain-containing protein [Prevotella sp.]|nr:SusE domain-containing protein [Prevotella sp.]
MKAKYFKSGLLFAAFAMLFTACDSDRDDNPVLGPNNTATEFVLNESPLSEQYIQLSADNTVKLTWSQPNYGVNTPVNYKVQVGLVENGTVKWNENYLETGFTTCSANVSGEELAKAICQIDGFATEDDYVDMGFREIAMRVCANVQTTTQQEVEGTSIVSNYVTFKHMAAYCMIPSLAYIYVIGNCSGWTEPAKANAEALAGWRIYETEIGNKYFHGVLTMPDYTGDALMFRFYTKLTGWDGGDSYGFKVDDEATSIELTDGVYTGAGMTGKGAWSIADFPGGDLDITVDLNKNTVRFELLK